MPRQRSDWTTDGTPDTETLLLDIEPGAGDGVEFQSLRCLGNHLYFKANDGTNGDEPWLSDGTTAGTLPLADINPGAGNGVAFAPGFNAAGGLVFFPANDGVDGYELWAVATSVPSVPALPPGAVAVLVLVSLGTGIAALRGKDHDS